MERFGFSGQTYSSQRKTALQNGIILRRVYLLSANKVKLRQNIQLLSLQIVETVETDFYKHKMKLGY